MSAKTITNCKIVLPDRIVSGWSVQFEGGKIRRIAPTGRKKAAGKDVFDAGGGYLCPGFIDLHIHGLHRHLIDDGPEHLAAICKILPQYGVTGFLPTVCPLPKGQDAMLVASLARVRSAGAKMLGFHLEGPFLTQTGSLPADALGQADAGRVKALIEAGRPYKTIFSIAPDFERIVKLMPLMAGEAAPVFMTHTAASVAQTQAAIEAGARHATHFYDVWPSPPVSEPGVRPCGAVEAVLADPRVSVDFILDGQHVHPVAVKMALACKGPDRVCLVSDANIGTGLPPGRYEFVGGTTVEFASQGAPARFTKDHPKYPGALAGSGLTMDQAVRNAVNMLGVDLPQAVRMASANPAQVLGLSGRKGSIAIGLDADMLLLDKNLNVTDTWVGGQHKFAAGS